MDKKKAILTVLMMVGIISVALLLVIVSNLSLLKLKKNRSDATVTQKEVEIKVASDGRVLGTNLQSFLNDEDFFETKENPETNVDLTVENNTEDSIEFVESEELVNIDFLIHTVDEINELEEDARAKDLAAGIDADDTENDKLMKGNAVTLGIDVSGWNNDIDWVKVKNAGVRFAIIRCGYRGYGSGWLVEDSYFQKNLKGAKEAGVQVGIYFFTQAIDESEAIEEAKTAISLIGDTQIEYPIFIDTEGSGSDHGRADKLDVDTRTNVCKAFCDTIEQAGFKAGIYASCNWFNTKLHFEKLDQYVIWLAEYRSTPQFGEYYDMWQYTSKGSIDGIPGKVDLNVSYLGY